MKLFLHKIIYLAIFCCLLDVNCDSFGQIALPYNETFEGIVNANDLPTNWSRVNGTTSSQPTYTANTTYNRTNHTTGGSKFASFQYACGTVFYAFGTFNLTAGTTYSFSTWYITDGASGFTSLSLTYGITASAADQTNIVANVNNPVNTTYQQLSGNFTPSSSGTYYLAIKCISSSYTPWYLTIDDISVTATTSSPMTFTSCTTTQSNISTVAPSAVTQEIIGIQIVTAGSTSPLSVTQFTVNSNGSTNINDINSVNSAKIYYTGTTSTFATTTLFGQNTPTIANFNISGSQTLASGTNYFWLVYDISSGATLGDVVDGECTSLNVGGARTPTITAPSGNRTIAISYCTNTNTTNTIYYINNFSTTGGTSNITNNASGFSSGGYGNFTGMTVSATQGNSVSFSINVLTYTMGVGIWVDWNQDGDFADAGEQVYNSASYISSATGSFTVPLTATPGNTRMRVVADDLSTSPVACPGNSYTECEDYTFNVIAQVACTATPNAGSATISSASGCGGMSFTLSATGLSTGGGISYQWQTSPNGISGWSNISGATSVSYSTSTLTTAYYRLQTTCSNSGLSNVTNSVFFTAVSCTTVNVPATSSNNIVCGTSSTLYDNGGSAGDYSASSNGYTVLENDGSGVITISGTYAGIETCCDHLNFYSGIGTGGTLLATYNGSGTITTLVSAVGTPITVQFTSDGSVQGAGFALQVIYSGTCLVCTAPPAGGIAGASPNPACPGSAVTLSVTGSSTGSGLSYQWQSSPDNVTWTNISGATSTTYIFNATSTSWYRRIITCSGSSAYSTAVQVVVNYSVSCYCTSSATSTSDQDITYVNLGTLSNSTSCGSLIGTQGTGSGTAYMYSNFTASSVPVPSVMQNGTYPINVGITECGGYSYSHRVDVYIDFNQNGLLTDAGESFAIFPYSAPGITHNVNYNLTIPGTALTGTTLMRIVCVESSTSSPCGTYTWGETEDYFINIAPLVACTGTPTGGTASASPATICVGNSSNLTVSGYSLVSNLTFQWESSPNNSIWSTISGATSGSYTATPSSNTYYRCKITCTNSGLSAYSVSTLVSITSQPNDLPCNAQTILVNDLTPGDVSCATGTGEPAVPSCWTNGVINTVWYKFQAPVSGNVKIKTIVGSLLNTQIAVYSGSCGAGMTLVACNDDVSACGSSYYYNSELSVTGLTAGTWYYIAVDGYNNLSGSFSIVWIDASNPWPPVPGQDCISGVPMCSATFTIGNPGYQAVGNICDFPGGGGNCLLSGERGSVWYEITVNANGNLMFTLEPLDAVADLTGLITDDGTDYDFGIWKKTGSGAVSCADIAAGSIPLACNYSYIGVTGLYPGGVTPPSDSYTGHTYSSGAYDAAFEPPLAVSAGEVYWLVISNFSNSLSGFAINFLNSTNGFNFNIPNPLIWTGGASNTNWFDPRNWGNCSQIPDSSHSCIVAASSFYQPVINTAGAECKSITINSGASLGINGGFNLNVYGNYNNQGSFNANPGSSITMVGGATQTLDGIMVTPSEFSDLIVNKSVAKYVFTNQHIECSGSFRTMNANSMMNMNNNNLTVAGNFYNFYGNTTYIPGSGTLCFNGSTPQTYTNVNNILTLNNVTMMHSGSGVTIANNMELGISGILTLTSGKIITNGYIVIANNKATGAVSPGNNTSYVQGNLRRYLNQTGSYDFPVGHAAKGYQRANFNFVSASSINHLTAFFTPYSTVPGALGLSECSVAYNMPALDNGFWTITADANPQTGKYTTTLYNRNYSNASGATAFTVMSAHSSLGGAWQLLNGDGSSGICVGSPVTAVVRQNMSGFSNFGTAMSNLGPLPIELLSFTGKAFDKVNLLQWVTVTETNNDYFVPEKSNDGVNFVEMTHVKGAGNSNTRLYYNLTDADPISPVTYYKLKQVDFDGQFTYSDIISVDRNKIDNELEVVSVYPNPASNLINIELFASVEGYVEITIMDMFGQIIFKRHDAIQGGKNVLTYDITAFSQGMYFTHVKFLTSGNTIINRFVKK